jgi:hypothetical protein
MGQYYAGASVTVQGYFYSTASGVSAAVTPTAVYVVVGGPGFASQTYSTVQSTVTNPSTGTYQAVIDTTKMPPGDYFYRVYSTGTGQASGASLFTVLPDPV